MKLTACDVCGVIATAKPVRTVPISFDGETLDADLCGDDEAQVKLAITMALAKPKPAPAEPATADDAPEVEHG